MVHDFQEHEDTLSDKVSDNCRLAGRLIEDVLER